MILWQLRLGLFFISVWQNISLPNSKRKGICFVSLTRQSEDGVISREGWPAFYPEDVQIWVADGIFAIVAILQGEWSLVHGIVKDKEQRKVLRMWSWARIVTRLGRGNQNCEIYSNHSSHSVCRACVSGMTSFYGRPRGRRQKVLQNKVTATELLSSVFHHSLGILTAVPTHPESPV